MKHNADGRFDYDVIIIGAGPAGLNAAVVLARSRRRVLIIDSGKPRNRATHGVHNFLTRDGILPKSLLDLGRREAVRYGTKFIHAQAVNATCLLDHCRAVIRSGRSFTARKLLLATGVADQLPPIKGLRELYGMSVHHCPYCDGWEYRDQPLAILGEPHEATRLALSMLTWSLDLVICTNGVTQISDRDRRRLAREAIHLRTEKIRLLCAARGRLKEIVFADGSTLARAGIFFPSEQCVQSPLVRKLGCLVDEQGMAICDKRGRTGVPNLFLAGDANGQVQFAIVAAAEGATAAVAINHEMQQEDRRASASDNPLQRRS
jgi:thioredoxin reductase